jgi:hypothetical protein
MQEGDWFELDHSAWAFAAETGYQWTQHSWKPWLRAGYDIGSGDSDPSDGDHETFHQMVPSARIYSFSILYNMMNTEDAFVSLIFKPFAVETLTMRTDFHCIELNQAADRWYLGSGAMHDNIGDDYAARASNGKRELGQLINFTLTWNAHPDVTVMGYYGHFFGDDVVKNFFTTERRSDFAYVEMTVQF